MSSWFLRQGALHAIFHGGLWKSEFDFRLLSYYVRKSVHGLWAVALLKKNKTKNKKVTGPVYVAPTWRLDRSSDPNQRQISNQLI